jgi:hypothetical protein
MIGAAFEQAGEFLGVRTAPLITPVESAVFPSCFCMEFAE